MLLDYSISHLEVTRVDFIHDLQVAGEEVLDHCHCPSFQGLGQERVVGVGKGLGAGVPRLGPVQLFHIQQQPHQLWDGQCRVGVVQLDGALHGGTTIRL